MRTKPALLNAKRLTTATVAILLLGAAPAVSASSNAPAGQGLAEQGKYVATAGNCLTCHTSDASRPYAGGREFQTPFGTLYSTNITPDTETGIGDWSEEDLAHALRKGVRPDGAHLYPAFPYTAYTKMSDEDIAALYAYLRTIDPVKAPAKENALSFPYNQRWALGLWKALYHDEVEFESDASKSAEWNRGAYLVEALGHCGACHSPRGFLGGQSVSDAMTGGEYLDRVPTGEYRTWSAPNLTGAPNGLAAWPVEEVAAYLKTGQNHFTQTFGPMNEVIMNSTRHLSDSDVRAMAVYLKDLAPNPGKTAAPASDIMEGSALYDVHCGTCHLPSGLGDHEENSGATLVGSPIVQANSPASLINVILYGPERPEPPLPHRWKGMSEYGEKLTDEEIAAIATFLRASWNHKASPVTAKDVARQR
ncbi:c-type cytochrome [Steroidobacter cummioxidans]|uniref:c-type cytochrome n=1 Tax=Steroidobacter cummioxidans TaxID=1803913 RepID=UPI000E3178A8|nr:cytochrome c [Steroidobacter cummioxidans]